MNTLEQIHASNPIDESIIYTLELTHAAFDNGRILLAQSTVDVAAKLETDEAVIFQKSGIGIALPARSVEGKQDLNLQLDNVSNEVWRNLKAAVAAIRTDPARIFVTLRTYLELDLTAPHPNIVKMTAISASVDASTASLTASFHDIVNTSWPKRRYTPEKFPGLKYA